jgi:nitrite reductase (NADH) large subunit
MQYYRQNAKWLERTYTFMERVGVDEVRAVVVEDRDGDADQLDTAMQTSIDAYSDPWLEAQAPATPNQFHTVVTS